MLNIAINRTAIEVGSRNALVKLELDKLSPQILEQLFIYGCLQKISDSASTAGTDAAKTALGEDCTAQQRKDWLETQIGKAKAQERAQGMMEKAIASLVAGEWSMREGSGTVMRFTDAEELALADAKSDLTARFKQACELQKMRPKMENYILLGEPVAKFFHEKAKKLCWNDAAVMAWVQAQAESGKRDYLAEAQAKLDARAEQVASVDLGDLLAGL